MSNVSKFLVISFLTLSSTSLFSSEITPKEQSVLFRLKSEPVCHPKTGDIIFGFTRSEYHQCASTNNPSAKVVVYSREDESLVSPESVIPYPDQKISDFLDTFHMTVPQELIKFPILTMLHYMRTLEPNSEEQCRAKLAIHQYLHFANPDLAQTITTWEKQLDAVETLIPKLFKLAETNPTYTPQAYKAHLTADSIRQRLEITYGSMGSFRFDSKKESNRAISHGKRLVEQTNKPLESLIKNAIQSEKSREAAEARESHTLK